MQSPRHTWPWLAAGALLAPAAAGAALSAAGVPPAWVALARAAALLALATGLTYGPGGTRPRWLGAPPEAWGAAALAAGALALWQAATGPLFLPAHLPPAAWRQPEVWANLATAALVAPAAEELFFRGAILPRLVAAQGPARGLAAGAALFALAHLDLRPLRLLELWLAGLVYGALWLRAGCLLPPTLAHGAGNLAAVLWGH